MQPPGSKVGAEIEKVAWVMFFFNPRGMGEEAKTQEWGAQFLGGEGGLVVPKIQLLKFIWALYSLGTFLICVHVSYQYAKHDTNRYKETIFHFFSFNF